MERLPPFTDTPALLVPDLGWEKEKMKKEWENEQEQPHRKKEDIEDGSTYQSQAGDQLDQLSKEDGGGGDEHVSWSGGTGA